MSNSKECSECKSISMYRCPQCDLRYCSVACCQSHKTHCQPIVTQEKVTEKFDKEILYPTEDTVSLQKLKLLSESEELKTLLNDTYLRETLKNINNEDNPEKILKTCMQQPFFGKFVDVVMNIVEPESNSQ